MSKKKREAKLAQKQVRQQTLDRRVGEALAAFWAEFPSPYDDAAEQESDRALCAKARTEAMASAREEDVPQALFEETASGDYAFRPWIVGYRDELTRRYGSEAVADRRARFQLAGLWVTDQPEMLRPDALKVAGALIRHLPIGEPVAEIPDPYESAEELEVDLGLIKVAWQRHFGDESLADDFWPPVFVGKDDRVTAAPWTGVLRELLTEKYGSWAAAEPRWQFLLDTLEPR